MTEKEKELLLAWIVNEDFRLDNELQELQQRVRFRKFGIEDTLELLLLKQRREDFTEFALIVMRLLRLGGLS